MVDGEIRKLPVFVFDLGGVVMKWPGNDPIFNYVATRYDVPFSRMKESMMNDIPLLESGKIDTEEYIRRSLRRVSRKLEKKDSAEELMAYPFEKFVTLNQSVVSLIKSLKNRGHQVFALSNTSPPHLEVIKRLGWASIFDRFFASFEMECIKPERKIYSLMMKSIGATPEDIVFVDDREENVRGARQAGIQRTILFSSVTLLKSKISKIIGD